jgi:hypothetical protein
MSEIQNQYTSEDEIDLIELFKKVYKEKKLIFKVSLFAVVLGIVYALFQPNEFTSSTTFIPQLSSEVKAGSSSLSGLASLAGINLSGLEGGSSSEIPPTLYPQVVESVVFKLELLTSTIELNNEKFSVREYLLKNRSSGLLNFIKKYTINLPSLISNSFYKDVKSENPSIYNVTEEDNELFKILNEVFSLFINDKEGFITMSFTDKNKNIAAQITQKAQSLLQEKIIEYKVQSSKELLNFTLDQYNENKSNFEMLQDKRAVFVDKNINISSTLYQNKLSRIESELSISETVLQQIATQVEQAKLKVNKDTPVFTIIKPVTVPFEKSSASRVLIVFVFLLFGFVLSCGYVFVKEPVNAILKSIKS